MLPPWRVSQYSFIILNEVTQLSPCKLQIRFIGFTNLIPVFVLHTDPTSPLTSSLSTVRTTGLLATSTRPTLLNSADSSSHVTKEQLFSKSGHRGDNISDGWQYSSTADTSGSTTPSYQNAPKVRPPQPSRGGGDSSSVDNGDSEALSMTTIYSVGAVVIVLLCVVLALLLKGLVEYMISFL